MMTLINGDLLKIKMLSVAVSLLGYVFSPYLLIFLKTEMQMAETTERFIEYSKL